MWPFPSKYNLLQSGIFNGWTDRHSHILPGVDDGIQSVKDSLAILSMYEQMGVKKVWLTPHIMEDCPNTPEKLKVRFEELETAYQGKIELSLSAENMMDGLFIFPRRGNLFSIYRGKIVYFFVFCAKRARLLRKFSEF